MAKKNSDPPQPDTAGKYKGAPPPVRVESPALGLTERRRSIRKLPVPEARESDRDSDWAAFGDSRAPDQNS